MDQASGIDRNQASGIDDKQVMVVARKAFNDQTEKRFNFEKVLKVLKYHSKFQNTLGAMNNNRAADDYNLRVRIDQY